MQPSTRTHPMVMAETSVCGSGKRAEKIMRISKNHHSKLQGEMEERATEGCKRVHVGACEGGRPLRDRRIMKEIREGEKGDVFKHNRGQQQFDSSSHEERDYPQHLLPYLIPSCCPLDNA